MIFFLNSNNPSLAGLSPAAKAAAPSLFGSGLFKMTTPEKRAPLFGAPLFGGAAAAAAAAAEEGEEAGGDSGNPEEFEPQVDFKPLVKLQQVETKTGEEGEEVLFSRRCKLFRFDLGTKEWKEKGNTVKRCTVRSGDFLYQPYSRISHQKLT